MEEFAKKLRDLMLQHPEHLGIEPTVEILQEASQGPVLAATTTDGEDLFIEIQSS